MHGSTRHGELQVWLELASTYSYPAAERVLRLIETRAAVVVIRPFLLGPIFADQGWNTSPFNIYKAKGEHMWRDLGRRCVALGLPLQRPSEFPRNGLLGARVLTALPDHAITAALACKLYRANFADDRDIADRAVVAGALQELGLDAEHWLQQASSEATKARLRDTVDEARALGLFGAPSFVVDGELFWGEDRLDQALALAHVPTSLEGLTIRPCTSTDVPAVLALWQAAGILKPHSRANLDIDAKLRAQPALFLLGVREERVIGSCMAGYEGRRGWLNGLAVHVHARQQGVGTALVVAAEARLRALGCPKVNLQVRSDNHQVMRFYERLGYLREDHASMGKPLP